MCSPSSKSGGRTASGGLPESISSTFKQYTINGNVVSAKGAKATVTNIEELKDKSILKRAKELGMEDPVVAGGKILPRNVAEIAIKQKEQERANYKANMEKNVKGYDELKRELGKRESERDKYRKSVEVGERIYSPQKTHVAELVKKYPRAASYLEAEYFFEASNYMKSSLGREAMTSIRMGEPHKKVIKTMKDKWKKYTEERMFD